jgi:two-component system response regulator HydG
MRAYLFVQEGPGSGGLTELTADVTVVGRGEDCAVRLGDAFVSRRHFQIERDASGNYSVSDLGGRSSLFLNGQPVRGRTKIGHGDEIRVGESCLRFTLGAPPAEIGVQTASAETRQGFFPADVETSDSPILGASKEMREVHAFIERAAPIDVTVLVTGESGTGKELVARALHEKSPRKEGPLVTVNCAAFPRELIESELFGHEKGAFTGAVAQRAGKFEQAHKGTLFLDEIGELPLEGQAKFLRVLEERKITRVGGTGELAVDVRIVAATHCDLHAMNREGRFRLDLIYRLEVASVRLPPLRDRDDDVVLLARHFLARHAKATGRPALALSDAAIVHLHRHQWPGNVRELRNVIERAALFAKGPLIQIADLGIQLGTSASTSARVERRDEEKASPSDPLAERAPSGAPPALDDAIKEQVERALAATGGNKKKAAELLKISRSSLYIYLERFKLR